MLRTANRFLGETFYSWQSLSIDGLPIACANGTTALADTSLDKAGLSDFLLVCSGFHPEKHCNEKTLSWLRKQHRHGVNLGAISTGTYILARAGVIGTRRCTIHKDNANSLRELRPDIDLVDGYFEICRNLYTCAGGTAAIDLLIHIVSSDHGEGFAADIARQFLKERVRSACEHQENNKGLRLKSKKLAKALDVMEENVGAPVCAEVLAEEANVSLRHLQRLFKKHTGRAPRDFYLQIRLNHVRRLLLQTGLPVFEIAAASGFASHAYFTKCCRKAFGYPPVGERKRVI